MADMTRRCSNGHPAIGPDQRFCETCGAAYDAAYDAGPYAATQSYPVPASWTQPSPPPPGPATAPTQPVPWAQPGPGAQPPAAPAPGWSTGAVPPPPPGPGWGQVPPAPPTWGPAAGAPAPRSSGSGAKLAILAILALAVVGGATAFILLAKPFGGGNGATPAPSRLVGASSTPRSSATSKPSRAPTLTPTTRPTPGPTEAPTPEPTPEPTAAPTPQLTEAPTPQPTAEPTPQPSLPDASSCRNETVGITVLYPSEWYAFSADANWKCLLFDPDPIVVIAESELPEVAVNIFADEASAKEVAKGYRAASVYKVLESGTLRVDGLDAVVYEIENTGNGFYDKGIRQMVFIVDRGSRGALVMETVGKPGALYNANSETLLEMVGSIKIDR